MPKFGKTFERNDKIMGQLEDLVRKDMSDSLAPWSNFFGPYLSTRNFRAIDEAYTAARESGFTVYPEKTDIFAAFAATPPERMRVLILGQDPYHGPGEAMGLAFSVRSGRRPQPSLANIKRELADDIPGLDLSGTDLTPWARQGVLLLNTSLTVLAGSPGSHSAIGWQGLTSAAAAYAVWASRAAPLVAVLWGRHARNAGHAVLDTGVPAEKPVLVIESPHPSPFSADHGFFGSRPFSRANDFLERNGSTPVDWSIPR